jgi:hypothetical protein
MTKDPGRSCQEQRLDRLPCRDSAPPSVVYAFLLRGGSRYWFVSGRTPGP